MIKNIAFYIVLLAAAFVFNIFYYAWFSWFVLLTVLSAPLLSLLMSLPFMIMNSVNGFVVYGSEAINLSDDFYIGIAAKKRKTPFCPLVKFTFIAENSFANSKKKIKILYGGSFSKPLCKRQNSLSKHCGCVEVRTKSCRIYDLTGIFFIPVKVNCGFDTYIMPLPEKPALSPELGSVAVLGYKPKSGGGFSDYYELRQYQSGDSLKNIHWKLSSKYDDLIVREPSQPIYRQFAVRAVLNNDSGGNDSVLAKLAYVCRLINKQGSACYAFADENGKVSLLNSDYDIKMFLKSLYKNIPFNESSLDRSNTLIYSIMSDREEVSGA